MASRSRRTLGFSADPAGTSRGEPVPPAVQQPTPVFPVMEQKPLPLTGGEEAEYLVALKQDFRGALRSLPCFIQPAAAHRDVERYSDKYQLSEKMDSLTDWIIDWKRFPRELRVQIRKPPRDGAALSCRGAVQSGQTKIKKMKKNKVGEKEEVLLKLETLEKEEQESSEGEEQEEEEEGEKKKKKEEEAEAEEEYDEEEFEEETDYIMSYFDNGEDFGGDSDDNMDEAIY